jgi:hypothetical protein
VSWIKLDDAFSEHPKIAEAGPIGAWVQIQALCYCARNLTDGFIPYATAQMFGLNGTEHIGISDGGVKGMMEFGRDCHEIDWPKILVECGLWETAVGGYKVHDYLKYNPSKSEVEKERKDWAKRQKQSRESRRDSTRESRASHGSPLPLPVEDKYNNNSGLREGE